MAANQTIVEGSTVAVQARMWSGMNKPGGVARVTACNEDGSYDVAFVLGGRSKNVEAKYVQIHALKSSKRGAAAAAPKPDDLALPQTKRRKNNDSTATSTGSNSSSDSGQTSDTNETTTEGSANNDVYKNGDIVVVEPRMWSGMNKPGGVGRVIKCDGKEGTVNVRYILGGVDKDIDFEYVKPEEQHENGETRSSKKNREKRQKGSSKSSSPKGSDDDDSEGSIPSSPSSSSSSSSFSSSSSTSSSTSSSASSSTSTSKSKSKDTNDDDDSDTGASTPANSSTMDSYKGRMTPDKRSPVSQMGYVTYQPDMERFELVRHSIAEMYRKERVQSLSVQDILRACQKALDKTNKGNSRRRSSSSSSSSSRSSSSSTSPTSIVQFDEHEICGHLNAIEPEGTIFFVRNTGMVYQLDN